MAGRATGSLVYIVEAETLVGINPKSATTREAGTNRRFNILIFMGSPFMTATCGFLHQLRHRVIFLIDSTHLTSSMSGAPSATSLVKGEWSMILDPGGTRFWRLQY